jgi:hypothetical protein
VVGHPLSGLDLLVHNPAHPKIFTTFCKK